jgi:hypothetical protein
MKAFFKTLVGDAGNIAGVAIVVGIAVAFTGIGHPGWAVIAMPAAALTVAAWLACH